MHTLTAPSRRRPSMSQLQDPALDLLCHHWTPRDRTRIQTIRRSQTQTKTGRQDSIWDAIQRALDTTSAQDALVVNG